MKIIPLTLALLILMLISIADFAQQQEFQKIKNIVQHPRILLLKGEENAIKQSIQNNPTWAKMNDAILAESDRMVGFKPLERIQTGRRLLSISRECIHRVFYLSYAYRMTGDDKYLHRAEQEMLQVAGFSDWNPSHFLDVGEMTMGMAIGYDWLYDQLSPQSRKIIRDAIIQKGLEPSFNENDAWFLTAIHNWNQVCNAGMTFGALAIYEDSVDYANGIIERAVNTMQLPMKEYGPDGAYPEGYSYWDYGTTFNVLFLSAIQKVYSSDFGLSKTTGFLETPGFMENMTGTTNLCYNWGDCHLGSRLNPAMFWFAQQNDNPSQLWVENYHLQHDEFSSFTNERILPALMIWGKDIQLDKITAPAQKMWVGQGLNPIALMRTSWTDTNGIYLGFKAGSPSVNHGHMDIGSFIMEADGVRWASDFGSQEYESLESKGIEVFGRTQDAQRWSIFRLNNYVHNTLTVNHELQRVDGYAKIDRSSDQPKMMYAISDISGVYKNQLAKAERGVAIVDSKYVVVRDETIAEDQPTNVRWTLLTKAQVEITGKDEIKLSKDGKSLILKINTSCPFEIKTWTTDAGTYYDAPNPGTTLVGFEFELKANQKASTEVLMLPGSLENKKVKFGKELEKW